MYAAGSDTHSQRLLFLLLRYHPISLKHAASL